MNKFFSYYVIAFATLFIVSCEQPRPQTKTVQQLISECDSLQAENATLSIKLHETDTIEKRFYSAYRIPFRPFYDCICLIKIKTDSVIGELNYLQSKIFFVVDNKRISTTTNNTIENIQHPNESDMISNFFVGDIKDSQKCSAHELKLRLRKTCAFISNLEKWDFIYYAYVTRGDSVKLFLENAINSLNTNDVTLIGGNRVTWEEANFRNATAAEDYTFLEFIKNKLLKARLAPLKYWLDEDRLKKANDEIMSRSKT